MHTLPTAMGQFLAPFAKLKVGIVHRYRFPTREAARSAIFVCLEAFYDRGRLRSSLGCMSLEGYEDLETRKVAVA